MDTVQRLVLDAATVLVFVAWGVVSVPVLDVHLGQGHLLRIEGGSDDLAVVPGYGGASVIVVRID
jgi:hypothetical protein